VRACRCWGRWVSPIGWRCSWPLATRFSATFVTMPNSVILDQTIERNYGDPLENFDPSRPAFQGHSSQWNRHGSIGYLWLPLVIHSNHGPIMYRFRNKKRQLQNSPPPRVFNTSADRVLLEFCNSAVAKKLEWCLYQNVKKWLYVHSSRNSTGIGQTDGQTDGFAITVSRSASVHADTR